MTTIRPADLNETEFAVLNELYKSSEGNGHDFGFTDDYGDACQTRQASGYVSQLVQKGYIFPPCDITVNDSDTYSQFELTEKTHRLFGSFDNNSWRFD